MSLKLNLDLRFLHLRFTYNLIEFLVALAKTLYKYCIIFPNLRFPAFMTYKFCPYTIVQPHFRTCLYTFRDWDA
jgi:hypothetical protein